MYNNNYSRFSNNNNVNPNKYNNIVNYKQSSFALNSDQTNTTTNSLPLQNHSSFGHHQMNNNLMSLPQRTYGNKSNLPPSNSVFYMDNLNKNFYCQNNNLNVPKSVSETSAFELLSAEFSSNNLNDMNNLNEKNYKNVPPLKPVVANTGEKIKVKRSAPSECNTKVDKRPKTTVVDLKNISPFVKNGYHDIRIFSGTTEKVIKWNKIYKKHFCLYEVIAALVTVQEGSKKMEKIFLIRDKKGPIMQIIHYEMDHIQIENFIAGQMLRCVGRMIGTNILHAFSIREATPEEVGNLLRMTYLSDHAVQRAISSDESEK